MNSVWMHILIKALSRHVLPCMYVRVDCALKGGC